MPADIKGTPNRLIHEKSPYLLQHAYNPVDWFPWGEEAFEKARAEDKPVFLSIGYSSCHWCHVMERESFEDEDVARLLNESFVAIKVDREERPDVDRIYMDACVAQNGSGGWPLSVFLTHDRKPFFTGTYFPKENRYGHIGFIELLSRIASLWKKDKRRLEQSAAQFMEYIGGAEERGSGTLSHYDADNAAAELIALYDEEYGGFGTAPKFPSCNQILFLLRHGSTGGIHSAMGTLDAMAGGGIRDHIGGGFFRYSTDRRWLVPHFEKMLYDQALLIMAYCEAYLKTGSFESVIRDTADYVLRVMQSPDGAFYTAQDADSEGVEGKYYLWTPEAVAQVLGEDDAERFCRLYDISEDEHMEGGCIPNRTGKTFSAEDEEFAAAAIVRLREARNKRVPPFLDEKIMATGNGLIIAALAKASYALDMPEYAKQAKRALDFVRGSLDVNGRLMATWAGGRAAHPATLDCYAYLIWAALELHRATLEPELIEFALGYHKRMAELFSDGQGGLYYTGADVSDLPSRQRARDDNVLPSAQSVAAANAIRLGRLTGDAGLTAFGDALIADAAEAAKRSAYSYASLFDAYLLAARPGADVVLHAGEGLDALSAALRRYDSLTVLAVGPGYEGTARYAPHTRDMRPGERGKAAAYVCANGACMSPVFTAEELKRAVEKALAR